MAALHPSKLDEYCLQKGISFFDLQIPCIFCKFPVSLQGLADFHYKDLCLVWKGDICYACCPPCLKLSANFEKENYCQCCVKWYMLESLVNTPLSEIIVRCIDCFKKLDYSEKIYCCQQNFDFFLVRCHWKNYCRICRYKK